MNELLQQYLLELIKKEQESIAGQRIPAMIKYTELQTLLLKDMRIALNKLYTEQKIDVHDSVNCKLIEAL